MPTRTARHRAEPASPITAITRALVQNTGPVTRQAAAIAAASGLVLAGGSVAHADPTAPARGASTPTGPQTASEPVTADNAAQVTFERPVVASEAPTRVPMAAFAGNPGPSRDAAPAAANAQGQGAGAAALAANGLNGGAPAQSVSAGVRAVIVAAAYAQLGVRQDCTMLVTNALAAAGIYYHGWPAGYLALGHTVNAAQAQPGDLVYYPDGGMGEAHIAVYVGNGLAVHGGWNGYATVLFSVNVGTGHTFIRVGD